MNALEKILVKTSEKPFPILDAAIPGSAYTGIDLSQDNPDLSNLNISKPEVCQLYIDEVLKMNVAEVAFGGYLERRNLYHSYANFEKDRNDPRNIHLGMDFWSRAGTVVRTPLDGKIHSFRNNHISGDYGPTIILEHTAFNRAFYTLYGHLSLSSLDSLYVGRVYKKGELLGRLGTPDINVNYAPHLHFQIIGNIQNHKGDYPGVCKETNLEFYKENCPDPNLLLKL